MQSVYKIRRAGRSDPPRNTAPGPVLRQAVAARLAIAAASPRARPSSEARRRRQYLRRRRDERGAAVTGAASTRHFDRGAQLLSSAGSTVTGERGVWISPSSVYCRIELVSPAVTTGQLTIDSEG
jgi:hypothetical protein